MHAAGMTARGGGFSHGSGHSGSGHGGSGHSGSGHSSFSHFHHHHFFRAGFGRWGYPWAYAYYPGGWDYPLDYSDYDQSSNQNQLQAYELQMMNNQQQIEQRIDSLEDRLDQLYEQRSAPASQAQANRQTSVQSESSQPAVLVYKDGHKQEVQNYAIVGQTIWVLNEQQARKVPLSALDLNATRKANEERDVEFAVPGSTS